MSLLLLSDMRTCVGDLLVDDDGVVTSTVRDRYINEAYIEWKLAQDSRPRELTSTQSGLTLAQGDLTKTITLVTIRDILRVYKVASNSSTVPTSAPLEILEPWEARILQADDATQGTPSMCALYRQGTDTVADVGKWVLLPWRIPNATINFGLTALVEPARMSAGTESPDVAQGEDYGICRVAAARIALSMGRDDAFIAALWQGVPEAMQAALKVMERNKGPRPRPLESPA